MDSRSNYLPAFFSSWNQVFLIAGIAFAIRALLFTFYIQYSERYRQPDSPDYHGCAFALAQGKGMFNVVSGFPIFWRTPGYPLYLSWFYDPIKHPSLEFAKHASSHWWALWLQLLLCSFIPLLIGLLTFALTSNSMLSWITTWISVFHVGFVLSSCFLLSDALALIPFFLSLILFFHVAPFWKKTSSSFFFNNAYFALIIAGLLLGIYTWIRPNGQFTFFLILFGLLINTLSWKKKIIYMTVFALAFNTTIAPWYIRNYQLTGRWFYCPMIGAYIQTFCAPKILRRLTGQSLVACINMLIKPAHQRWVATQQQLLKQNPPQYLPREHECAKVAWPILWKHPGWFLADWIQEVWKTSFDLYGHQLLDCSNGNHIADPPEDFLSLRLKGCLYSLPSPLWIRLICWLEALFSIFLWLGIIGGFILFLIRWMRGKTINATFQNYSIIWVKCAIFFASIVGMTGGFGYARLRLAAEPFLLIASAVSWILVMSYVKNINSSEESTLLAASPAVSF